MGRSALVLTSCPAEEQLSGALSYRSVPDANASGISRQGAADSRQQAILPCPAVGKRGSKMLAGQHEAQPLLNGISERPPPLQVCPSLGHALLDRSVCSSDSPPSQLSS